MSKFKGKRMVEEDLIKKLQDLDPSGSSYTAGTGIEISAENEISIDTDTVATKSELFSGDYDDLTNKPDLSVYELAADAFSGDYDDLTNKPDLSVYAENADLATVATTGSYNDLSNKPTIPAGVTVLTISTSVTFTSTQIANFVAHPENYLFKESDWANGDDYFKIDTVMSGAIMLTKTYVASSTNLYSEIFYINRSTGAVTKTDYNMSIPTISGTNDGTNWTSLTIDYDTYAIPAGGGSSYTAGTGIDITNDTISVDSSIVNTNTAQTITAAKTFQGTNMIKFKGDPSTDTLGFTAYDSSNNELGNLQIKQRSSQTRQESASTNRILVTLADYATDKNSMVGFRVRTTSGTNWQMNFVAPHMTYTQLNNTYGTSYNTYYMPMLIASGTNKVFADNTGKVDISSLLPSGTNDGTNWTSLTIGNRTYNIPASGMSTNKYLHKVKIYANFAGSEFIWTEDLISSSAVPYTSPSAFLTDRGYTVNGSSEQPSKSIISHGGSYYALAYSDTYGYMLSRVSIDSSCTPIYANWGVQTATPTIQDEVMPI